MLCVQNGKAPMLTEAVQYQQLLPHRKLGTNVGRQVEDITHLGWGASTG
jgi:hypothetical protein